MAEMIMATGEVKDQIIAEGVFAAEQELSTILGL